LNDLDKEFQNLKASGALRITGKELVEDTAVALKKFWRKQVVEPFSGARYFGEPFKVPNSDHFSIAKPQGRSSIQHRLLVEFITQEMERERQHSVAAVSPEPLLASRTATVSAEKNKNQGEANNGVGLGVARTETKSDTESDTRILDDKISRAILQALGRHAPWFASVYSSAYAAAASAYSRKDRAVALATQAQSLLGAKIARLRLSKTNKRFLAVHSEEFGDLGMVLWNSGDQYFGQVSGKQETGLGVYKIYASTRHFDANSIATFEGEMHAGSFGPHGVYRFTNGTLFAGEWIDSRPKHGFESFLHETFPYEFYFGNIGTTEDRLWLPHGKGISVSLKTSIITCGTFHFGVAVRDIETVTLDPDHE